MIEQPKFCLAQIGMRGELFLFYLSLEPKLLLFLVEVYVKSTREQWLEQPKFGYNVSSH